MSTPVCPFCATPLAKCGRNRVGTQCYRCRACRRYHTPYPKEQGHAAPTRHEAVRLYLAGMSLRKVARHLGVVHQSVANWVAAHAATLPEVVADATPTETVEADELVAYVGGEKAGGLRGAGGGA